MQRPSGHLLRTFAAVPVAHRVLELGCGPHTDALARLGFDLHACATAPAVVEAARAVLAAILDPEAARRRVILVARLDALGYPDQFFDWIIAYDVLGARDERTPEVLAEARRVLKAGGWLYVAASAEAGSTVERLGAAMRRADFALAEQPEAYQEAGRRLVRGIYRRVDPGTPV